MSVRSLNKTRAKIASQGKHSVIVQRSNNHFYAQIMNPSGIILGGLSTKSSAVKKEIKDAASGNCAASQVLGAHIAKLLKSMKISHVAFDRSGRLYHGRVAAFVNGMRENGIQI